MARTSIVALALALALLGVGCASAHEATDVGSGIYELTVRGDLDACSPTRATGDMGAVGIVSEVDVLNVGVPDGIDSHLARVSLARADGFTTETDLAIEGCPGATLRRSWSVTESSPERFEVVFAQEWTGIAGCAAMPAAPLSDCRAEQVLDYRLSLACASPCDVLVVEGTPTCACE